MEQWYYSKSAAYVLLLSSIWSKQRARHTERHYLLTQYRLSLMRVVSENTRAHAHMRTHRGWSLKVEFLTERSQWNCLSRISHCVCAPMVLHSCLGATGLLHFISVAACLSPLQNKIKHVSWLLNICSCQNVWCQKIIIAEHRIIRKM